MWSRKSSSIIEKLRIIYTYLAFRIWYSLCSRSNKSTKQESEGIIIKFCIIDDEWLPSKREERNPHMIIIETSTIQKDTSTICDERSLSCVLNELHSMEGNILTSANNYSWVSKRLSIQKNRINNDFGRCSKGKIISRRSFDANVSPPQ
jgi:hypothetical protein